MSTGRTLRAKRVIAASSVATLAALTLLPTSSYAEPSIDEVEDRLDTLYHEAERAQERLNTLNVQMRQTRGRLVTLKADLREQRRTFDKVSYEVAGMVADEAQGDAAQLSAVQELVLADDPDEFLDTIAAKEALGYHQGAMIHRLRTEERALAERRRQVGGKLASLADDQRQAAKEETTVDARVADAQELLDELEAEKQARIEARRAAAARAAAQEAREAQALAAQAAETQDSTDTEQTEALAAERRAQQSEASRSGSRTPAPAPAPAPSSSAGTAAVVDFATSQIGDAYVYGAAGPDAWDCSGLTMAAWSAAGVSLSHSSTAQYGEGTPVSTSQLQPGDLVFYYQPISHVGVYVGGGQIVHASNPSSPVGTAPVDSMPISGAVRPG